MNFQWTLMGYMIEGGGSKTMSKAKYWLENYADDSKKLLDILTSVIVDYFEMQVTDLRFSCSSTGAHLHNENFVLS